jgi:molybdenum cofactor guanylyltransferase
MRERLHGLLLAGGKSTRMGRDKASMVLGRDGMTQAEKCRQLLAGCCIAVHLSLRDGQEPPDGIADIDILRDAPGAEGPLAGILAALAHEPRAAWLVLACDLPFVTSSLLEGLASAWRGQPFFAYASASEGLPEPLCAIYGPEALPILRRHAAAGRFCPRRIMIDERAHLLPLPGNASGALANINTPGDLSADPGGKCVRVAWFGRLAEARGLREEDVRTTAGTAIGFLRELEERHALGLDEATVRVAVNDEFAAIDQPLCHGDKVVFLTPFSGG